MQLLACAGRNNDRHICHPCAVWHHALDAYTCLYTLRASLHNHTACSA